MNPDRLDDLLCAYAGQPVPEAPEDLPSQVRQEIKLRKGRFSWIVFRVSLGWRELVADLRLSLAAFACAFVVGVFPTISMSKAHAQERLVRQSLHLDVFAFGGPGQIKGLLTDGPGAPHSQRP